jgi:putative membrane protein
MNKVVVLAMVLGLPLVAYGKDANPDESFYKNAAEAGIAEVVAGEDAQSKGSSQAVKDFGAMMVQDHTAANNKLKSIATKKGVELPTEPGVKHKAMKKMLDTKSGASFDKDYVNGQIKDHKDTIDLLKKEIATGQDPEAKAFASQTLPTVEAHLAKINQIAASMGSK